MNGTTKQTFAAFTRSLFAAAPETALEIAIKATELIQAEAAVAATEAKALGDVKLGPTGWEANNLLGIWRLGELYASSQMVPTTFRGKPSDCAIVAQLAIRFRVDPFLLFHHVYPIHSRIGLDAQLAIAMFNNSGLVDGTIGYEFFGTPATDLYGCRAAYTERATGARVIGPDVTWAIVKAEGWDKPKGDSRTKSKWETMPDLMFRYRSAMWLIRAYHPEVIMGMQSADELVDAGRADRGETIPENAAIDALKAAVAESSIDHTRAINEIDQRTARAIAQTSEPAIPAPPEPETEDRFTLDADPGADSASVRDGLLERLRKGRITEKKIQAILVDADTFLRSDSLLPEDFDRVTTAAKEAKRDE